MDDRLPQLTPFGEASYAGGLRHSAQPQRSRMPGLERQGHSLPFDSYQNDKSRSSAHVPQFSTLARPDNVPPLQDTMLRNHQIYMDSKGRQMFGRSSSTVDTRVKDEYSPLRESGKALSSIYSLPSGLEVDKPPHLPPSYHSRSNSQDVTAGSTVTDSMKLPIIRKKMEDLFVYYAQLGDRLNTTHLKSHKFHKILVDSGLEEAINQKTFKSGIPKLARERVDLVFSRCTRSTLTFAQFLTALVYVAEEYQKHITTFYESSKMILRRKGQLTGRSVKGILIEEVLKNHLLPLHEKHQNQMNQETDFQFGWNGDQLAKELLTLRYNQFISTILKDVGALLNQIYKQFFPQELV